MRKRFLIVLVGAAAAGGAWWFWSLGSLPAETPFLIRLRIDKGPVEVRHAGQDSWQPAKTDEDVVPGDEVRTGPEGDATIVFEGNSESRLGKDSDIVIERAPQPALKTAPFVVELRLITGRVWSRVLRLLDIDDAFAVRTDSVVATVRGTAFDLQRNATGTVLWVSDAAVEVSGRSQAGSVPSRESAPVMTEGFMARFDAGGNLLGTQAISEESRQGEWFLKNASRDATFVTDARASLRSRVNGLGGAAPGSLTEGLTRLSERLHLTTDRRAAPERFGTYVLRRLNMILRTIDSGSSGLAFQALTVFEGELDALTGADADAYRKRAKGSVSRMLFLLQDVSPDSPVYRMKQRLENLNLALTENDDIATAYAHLSSIESRLDEAGTLIAQSSLDGARNALDAARQGLGNVERDIDRLPDTAPQDRVRALRSKLNILKAREAAIRVRLETALEPPTSQLMTGSATDTEAVATTETLILPPGNVLTATTTPTEPAGSAIVRITLAAQPNPAFVGDTVKLVVTGYRADNTTADVTAKSQFSLSGKLGTLNGPTYTSNAAGSVTINASYQSGGTTLKASVVMNVVVQPATLQSLELAPAGSATISFGQTLTFTATVHYSDGKSKDVTGQTTFTSSNTQVGTMSQNVFTAQSSVTTQLPGGTSRVTGRYSDASGTATAFTDVQVAQ